MKTNIFHSKSSHYLVRVVGFILIWMIILSSQAQIGNGEFVISPSWSPDGGRIATVINNNIEIRDTSTGHIIHILIGHTDFVPMVAWSPDGNMIATPSFDQTVKVWDTNDGRLLHNLIGHNESITSVEWSADNTRILSFGLESNPSLFIWDALTGDLITHQESGTIVAVAVSPDKSKIALLNSLGIGVINEQTLEVLSGSPRVQCCINQMRSMAWNPDSSKLVTGSLNGLVTLWDANTATILKQFVANPYYEPDSRDVSNLALSWVRDVTFSPDGNIVMGISGNGTLREWDIATGDLIQERQVGQLYGAAWSPYSGQLAVLRPSASELPLNNEQTFDANTVTGILDFVVPDPTLERLNSIAQGCISAAGQRSMTFATDEAQLSDFTAQIESLSDAQIPPACKADLLAIIDAIEAQ